MTGNSSKKKPPIQTEDQAESTQSFSLDYLVNLFNAISDAIFVKDRAHRWIFANDSFSKILGKPLSEYLYKSDYDLFPKELADVFWKKDDEIFKFGIPNENEEIILDPHGNERVIITKKTPVQTENGMILVGIIRDITEEKKATQQMMYAARMSTLGEITSGLTHDLNNPTAIILGRAQQLKRLASAGKITSLDVVKIAESIEGSCKRSLHVLHELNKLSTPSLNRVETEIDLQTLFNGIKSLFKSRFDNLSIIFNLQLKGENLHIFGVEAEIRQVLITLTQFSFNSVYHSDQRKIEWIAYQDGKNIHLRISDTGTSRITGSPTKRNAFTSTAQNPQFAVGFSVVESIIAANHGTLKLSQPKDWWSFEVIIPAYIGKE